MLSKVSDRQGQLFGSGFLNRDTEWVVQPSPQVAVGQQIEAEQRHQIRKAPFPRGFQLQKFQQQHGNQCCPNLGLDGVFAGADEGFDLQVLLQVLEKEFNLPAKPIALASVAAERRGSLVNRMISRCCSSSQTVMRRSEPEHS